MFYGAIEAGGTKMNCAVADERSIIDECSLPTTTPEETMAAIFAFLIFHCFHFVFLSC